MPFVWPGSLSDWIAGRSSSLCSIFTGIASSLLDELEESPTPQLVDRRLSDLEGSLT